MTGLSGRKPAIQISLRKVAGEQYLSKKAGDGVRTCDLIITNDLLYQLSYTGHHLSVVRSKSRSTEDLNYEGLHSLWQERITFRYVIPRKAVFCLHAATIPSSEQAPVMG